jgi:hypothetical protein
VHQNFEKHENLVLAEKESRLLNTDARFGVLNFCKTSASAIAV